MENQITVNMSFGSMVGVATAQSRVINLSTTVARFTYIFEDIVGDHAMIAAQAFIEMRVCCLWADRVSED